MARSVFENTDQSLDEDGTEDVHAAKSIRPRRKPIIKGGASSAKYINAATQGGADRSYKEIPVDHIQSSQIRDRIDVEEDIDKLIESIQENGQQIPILVRIVQGDKPYEIVVGRRRLAAIRKMGQPNIKAFVAKMDEREAFRAQGIENSARLETSFIERARAAMEGLDAGYDQKDVAEFLNISPTLINMMTKIFKSVGEDLVVAIGAARGVGRRKWAELISEMERQKLSRKDAELLVDVNIHDSVDRFHALLKSLKEGKTKRSPTATVENTVSRSYLGGGVSTTRKPHQLTVKTRKNMPDELLEILHQAISDVIVKYEAEQEEK